MQRFVGRVVLVLLLLAAAAGLAYAVWPKPIEVEAATAVRGPMRVTVDEDGRTRIKERYIVSSPLAGRLGRIEFREGDPVVAGETILASIDPLESTLLDPRARAEAEARLKAAEAGVARANALLQRSNTELEQAQNELHHLEAAEKENAVRPIELERAGSIVGMREKDRSAAEFGADIARFELSLAQAALTRTNDGKDDAGWRLEIKAPASGRVLRVLQESAAVVQPGAPLVEVGDPSDLELVVDVLSSDGVAILPGAAVSLEQWGGEQPLRGRVRRVEPAAFTKISSLGVEEQRVNVIIDFVDPPEARAGLGDGFRVEARIETWNASEVLTVPLGALFRHGGGPGTPQSWALYRLEDGRAVVRKVEVGKRNANQAEIRAGLEADDRVVVYPSDRVHDGARVRARGER